MGSSASEPASGRRSRGTEEPRSSASTDDGTPSAGRGACPDCGVAAVVREGGCPLCRACGWTACAYRPP